VSMLEKVGDESNDTDSVVVSTMEKIHRVHSESVGEKDVSTNLSRLAIDD